MDLAGLVGLAVALFASTNVDDLFVLLGFFADPRFRAREVAFGQCLGIGALYGASVAASLISYVVPAAYIGLLGLVPIALGVKKLRELRSASDETGKLLEDREKARAGHGNVVAVAAVTLANGGDNIGIYTPLFAVRPGHDIAVIGVVFVIMTLAWLWAAHRLTRHRTMGAAIRRYGSRLMPVVLIALGGLILHEAGTFELLRR